MLKYVFYFNLVARERARDYVHFRVSSNDSSAILIHPMIIPSWTLGRYDSGVWYKNGQYHLFCIECVFHCTCKIAHINNHIYFFRSCSIQAFLAFQLFLDVDALKFSNFISNERKHRVQY